MPHDEVLRIRIPFVSAGAASEDIDTEAVPRGEVWKITNFAFEDITTAVTEARVGIARGRSFQPLVEQDAPVAATLYWTNWEYYLGEGEVIRLRVTGPTTGDQIELYVNGLRLHHSSHLNGQEAPEMVLEAG